MALILIALISIPYLVFTALLAATQFIYHYFIAAYEIQSLLIAFFVLILSLMIIFRVWGHQENTLSYRINSKADIFLILFMIFVSLSYFMTPYKSAYWDEMFFWSQAVYLYFFLPLIFPDNPQKIIDGVIEAIILSGGVIAIVASYLTYNHLMSMFIPRNPYADYLVIPFFLICARLYSDTNVLKRLLYWSFLSAIVLFFLLAKDRAVWISVVLCFIMLCVSKKDFLQGCWQFLRRNFWENILIALGVFIVAGLSMQYNHRLDASNYVGIDRAVKSLSAWNEGSIYGRIRLWCNSLFIIKDHWLLGVGLNNWRMIYPLYNKKIFFDAGLDERPVNFYLKLAVEIGIPGTLAMLAYLWGQFKSFRLPSPLSIFIKCGLFSIFFVAFSHDLYTQFIPLVFVLFLLLSFLQTRPQIININKTLVLTLCLFFNLIFAFQCIIRYKALEFNIIGNFFEHYYDMKTPLLSLQDKILYPLVNDFANSKNQSSPLTRYFLKTVYMPWESNLYLPFAKKIFGLTHDYDQTLGLAQKSAEISPLNYRVVLYQTNMEYQAGKYSEAHQTAENYLNKGYIGLWLRKTLADTDSQMGQKNEAINQYELAKTEYDHMLGSLGQENLNDFTDYFSDSHVITSKIDYTKKNLGLYSPQDSMKKIESTLQYNFSLGFSPQNHQIYFSSNLIDGFNLYSFNRDNRSVRQLTKFHDLAPFKIKYSPTTNRIYFTSDWQGNYAYNIFYWDLGKSVYRKLTDYHDASAGEYELSPDEKEIAYVLKNKSQENLFLLNTNSTTPVQLTVNGSSKDQITWDPLSTQIAYVCHHNSICLYNIFTHKDKHIVSLQGNIIKTLQFSKDGRYLLFASQINSEYGQIYAYDFATARFTQLTHDHNLKLFPQYITPTKILYVRKIYDNYLLNIFDTSTKKNTYLGPQAGVVYGTSIVQSNNEIIFLFADNSTPCTIGSMSLSDGSFHTLRRLDNITVDDIIYPYGIVLKGSGHSNLPVYYYSPYHFQKNKKYPVIIWLHGGHEEFSPRWQIYTQYFGFAGFAVYALNYRENNTGDLFKLCDFIRHDPSYNNSNIYVVGVSLGGKLVEKALSEHPGAFKGVVEYVGVVNSYFNKPINGLPPMKIFLGEHDAAINTNEKKIAQIHLQQSVGNDIDYVMLPQEGHDFRHQRMIQKTLEDTVEFFSKIENHA